MIYDIGGKDGYEFIDCVLNQGWWTLQDFNGSSRAAGWKPISVVRVVHNERPLKPADIPWSSSSELVMRTRAVIALRDMLEAGGEILPLSTVDDVKLYVLNVTRVLDALDEQRSILERYDDTGEIMFIRAAAFHEHMVRGVPFFKLPRYGSALYIGEPFRQRVLAAGLTGLDFQLAWSPEAGAIEHTVL